MVNTSTHMETGGVAAALPDARVEVLPGEQHAAIHTAPERFVSAVRRFLEKR